LPVAKEKELKELLKEFEVVNNVYEDDDGDDENGRQIILYLHSYVINKKKDDLEE